MYYFALQYPELKQREPQRAELIEQAAMQADADLAGYILRNVALGIPERAAEAPCGRRQFYEKRKRFFIALDALRK